MFSQTGTDVLCKVCLSDSETKTRGEASEAPTVLWGFLKYQKNINNLFYFIFSS